MVSKLDDATHLMLTNERLLAIDLSGQDVVKSLHVSEIAAVDIHRIGFLRPNALTIWLDSGKEIDFGEVLPADNNQLLAVIRQVSSSTQQSSSVGASWQFNTPPGWPAPPLGWKPPAGWQPDSRWPLPPRDWQFWVAANPATQTAVPEEEIPTSESGYTQAPIPNATKSTTSWAEDIPLTGSKTIPPNPRALESLGRNHSLPTALSDLVDNSIDAGASDVLIRFVRSEGRLRSLYVVDNGSGMSDAVIDSAMQLGGERSYDASNLGKFGVGLQTASLSQASSLTVLSQASQTPAVGRRLTVGHNDKDFTCDVVQPEYAAAEIAKSWGIPMSESGTIIRWDTIRAFPASSDPQRVDTFITVSINEILNHLGLVFHRILEKQQVTITIDVKDTEEAFPGPATKVAPLNPFGYLKTGKAGYPKEIIGSNDKIELRFHCHIWTPRSQLAQFQLIDKAEKHQGFYFYRNDRLLQAGGSWDGIQAVQRDYQLARVAIDIDGDIDGIVTMNAEKTKVQLGPDFALLAESARATDGTTLSDYLTTARDRFKDGNKRSKARASMIPPGKGFAPEVRSIITNEVPSIAGKDPVNIRWRRFDKDDDRFFEIDRETSTIQLNERYRPGPSSGMERTSLNDMPLVKSLLYLVMENAFHGERVGPRDRDNIVLWNAILTTAVKAEPGYVEQIIK